VPSRLPQFLLRASAVVVTLGLSTGAIAAVSGTRDPSTLATDMPAGQPTTSTTVALPPTTVTVPPAPATTAAPRPAPATTAPRPTATTAKPAPSHVTQAAPVPSGDPNARGQQALALINYPWQKFGYTISFEPGDPTYLGMTDSGARVIHIFVRNNESMDTLKRTTGHELGHVLDFTMTSDDERAQYIAIRGINATVDTWYGCNACEDYSTAAGDWAETFQYWLFGPGQYFSKMGPPPNADQSAQLSTLFAPQ
jgi:hypothetical protein